MVSVPVEVIREVPVEIIKEIEKIVYRDVIKEVSRRGRGCGSVAHAPGGAMHGCRDRGRGCGSVAHAPGGAMHGCRDRAATAQVGAGWMGSPAQPKALGRPRRDGGRRGMWPPPAPKQPLPSRRVGSPHRARPRPQPSARAPQVPVDVIKEVPKIVEIIKVVEVPIIKEVILGARTHPPPPRAPLEQIKIVEKPVIQVVEKEIIKEIEVIKEVVVEREVERIVEKVVEVIVEKPVEIIKEVFRGVPYEVIKEVEVVREVEIIVEKPVEVIKEVIVEVIREVQVPVVQEVVTEVIKEVPVEVIREVMVDRIVEVMVEKPIEIIKEIIKEVPIEVIRVVEVVREVEVDRIVREVIEVIKEVPVDQVIREVPRDVIKEVPVEVIKIQEVPYEVVKWKESERAPTWAPSARDEPSKPFEPYTVPSDRYRETAGPPRGNERERERERDRERERAREQRGSDRLGDRWASSSGAYGAQASSSNAYPEYSSRSYSVPAPSEPSKPLSRGYTVPSAPAAAPTTADRAAPPHRLAPLGSGSAAPSSKVTRGKNTAVKGRPASAATGKSASKAEAEKLRKREGHEEDAIDELIKAALSTDSRSGLSAVRGGSGHNLYPEKQGSGVRHDLLRGNLTAWGKSGSADYSASDLPVGELIGGPERRSNGLSDILGRPSAVSSSAITAMRAAARTGEALRAGANTSKKKSEIESRDPGIHAGIHAGG
eukprot:scaffold2871_cov106-Isochrysis_galbana.AAC.3